MIDRNPLYDFGDEGEGEAPTFNEKWGSLPVEAPRFNLTPNVALVESTPKSLKQGTDPVTGRPDLKFVPVDDPWANIPKPIKRLLGVGGEERYQLWPERALRSGLSAPLDAMQGKLPTIDPEIGDVPRMTMEPNLLGRMLGMSGGWQGVSPEGAIGRAQDVASVGGPGGLMNLREEGILGSHGGNLVQPTPKVAAPFYSAVEHAVSNIKQEKMPADQWLGTLTNSKGVKPEELDWTGLKDHLSSKGKEPVTKQEVQDYVNANKVELKEVTGGNLKPEPIIGINGKTTGEWRVPNTENRFKTREEAEDWAKTNSIPGDLPTSPMRSTITQYQLPGGSNYKEMLMTLPNKEAEARRANGIFRTDDKTSEYKSSHWDEPNVLAHVRTNDRNITAPGETTPKKSLHIEEIQSDWHQQAREEGYKAKQKDIDEAYNNLENARTQLREKDKTPSIEEIHDTLYPFQKKYDEAKAGLPDAPFKKTWHELALKRMIREAAEKGYDRLSWTPGEAQATRYDLSKQVNEIQYFFNKNSKENGTIYAFDKNGKQVIQKNANTKELPDIIGKEAADKLINNPTEKRGGIQISHYLSGQDLKVGGEGMKGFYDKMILNAIEKIGKEHGVRVKQAKIDQPKTFEEYYNSGKKYDPEYSEIEAKKDYNKYLKSIDNPQPVHYIDIPESLKHQALGKGFPLFSSGGHLLNPIPGNPHEQVDNSHHVPYGAGASNTPTGFPVNIDKRIPKYDDKLKLPNGQPADLHKYLTIHEIEEYKAMKAGIPYHKAHHEIATPMEKKAVESDGVSWKEYEHIMDGYLKETEEGGYRNLPPRLYTKPYPHSRSLKMDHGELDK